MRKEYNDRWTAPLVNPGFTMDEYEAQRAKTDSVAYLTKVSPAEQAEYFAKIQERSEANFEVKV